MQSRIDALESDIDLIISRDLSPEARSSTLAGFARETLARTQATNQRALGRLPPHVTFVDGRVGVAEAQVRPEGTIVYEFQLASEMLDWIAEQLRRHSPVSGGRYRRSHELFMDGTAVNTDSYAGLRGGEFVFLSTVAYARKIEGNGTRPPESRQAPDGVYEVVAGLAKQRFGKIAKVYFAWRSPIGEELTHLERWARVTTQTRPGRRVAVAHWNRRQPAIIVIMR